MNRGLTVLIHSLLHPDERYLVLFVFQKFLCIARSKTISRCQKTTLAQSSCIWSLDNKAEFQTFISAGLRMTQC